MLKLKLQYFAQTDAKSWLTGKDPDAGKYWGKGVTEDEMIEWYHWLNGHELEQSQRDSDGQKPSVLQFVMSQRDRHDLVTEQ